MSLINGWWDRHLKRIDKFDKDLDQQAKNICEAKDLTSFNKKIDKVLESGDMSVIPHIVKYLDQKVNDITLEIHKKTRYWAYSCDLNRKLRPYHASISLKLSRIAIEDANKRLKENSEISTKVHSEIVEDVTDSSIEFDETEKTSQNQDNGASDKSELEIRKSNLLEWAINLSKENEEVQKVD